EEREARCTNADGDGLRGSEAPSVGEVDGEGAVAAIEHGKVPEPIPGEISGEHSRRQVADGQDTHRLEGGRAHPLVKRDGAGELIERRDAIPAAGPDDGRRPRRVAGRIDDDGRSERAAGRARAIADGAVLRDDDGIEDAVAGEVGEQWRG